MKSVTEFLAMGGYATYVWTSYALAAVILVWNIVQPMRRERRLLQTLARRAKTRTSVP